MCSTSGTLHYQLYMYFGSNKPQTQWLHDKTRAGPLSLITVVVMETAPQSRCTHKHCITQCISVEPPSSSLRQSPLLVCLSAPSRLHLPYRRERYWSKRFSSNNCREKGFFSQLYESLNKEGLCSGVDLSVKWWERGWQEKIEWWAHEEEGKDWSKRPLPVWWNMMKHDWLVCVAF